MQVDITDVGSIPGWGRFPVFLPGESHGQRSLAGYCPQCRTELDTHRDQHFRLAALAPTNQISNIQQSHCQTRLDNPELTRISKVLVA